MCPHRPSIYILHYTICIYLLYTRTLYIHYTGIDLKTLIFGSTTDQQGAYCGIVLLLLFLFFDSFTGQFQTRMFIKNKLITPIQMMLITNAFSAVFSFVTLIHQEELSRFFIFIYTHHNIILHITIFIICNTIGQLLIFACVKNFGPLVFSIFMTVRILCSTLLSCFVYSHPITELGVIGTYTVCVYIMYEHSIVWVCDV